MTTEEIFKIKKVTPDDYAMLNSWYAAWGFSEIAVDQVLPEYGAIVEYQGVGIIAAFLFLTDSVIAHPEWIVTNKEFKHRKLYKLAFIELFKNLEEVAKAKNYHAFILSVKNSFLIKSLEGIGFRKTDTNMTNLIKEI